MKNLLLPIFILTLCSAAPLKTLRGTWRYAGGYYNGHKEGATKGYLLERKYNDTSFTASMVEKGSDPERYQTGRYKLTKDSCFETETWNSQSTRLTGVTLHYHHFFRHDTLFFKGRLPGGMYVLECWKKVR